MRIIAVLFVLLIIMIIATHHDPSRTYLVKVTYSNGDIDTMSIYIEENLICNPSDIWIDNSDLCHCSTENVVVVSGVRSFEIVEKK